MIRIRLSMAIAAVVFVSMAGASLPPPTYDYDGCPPPTLEWCGKDRPKLCNSTTVCGFGEKCCPVSCNGMQCMPAGQKPGQCEDPKRELADCMINAWENSKADCAYDYQCGGTLKCCQQTCVKPLCKAPMKPGQCPVIIQGCASEPDTIDCNADEDCNGTAKCCGTSCFGKKCIEPRVEVRKGICPNTVGHESYCLTVVPSNDCSNDEQCPTGKRCCKKPCGGLGCMDTVTVYPPAGTPVCPVYDKNLECKDKRTYYTCNPEEEKCSNGGKCCPRECSGTSCDAQLCPAPDRNIQCFAPEKRLCNTSAACGGGQVCCEIYCGGTRCVTPIPPTGSNAGSMGSHCGGSGYPGAQPGPNTGSVEGSSGSANPSGVQAVKGNPTPICPKPDKTRQCPDSLKKRACQSDAQCGNKKCCDTGCNVNICQTPVRPGTCPNIMAKCPPATEADKKSQCGTDMSCPGSQKCCSNPCAGYGAICLDPVKEGTCPMTIQGCPADQTISNKCTGDYDCTGNLKCCSSGCGRTCLAPVA